MFELGEHKINIDHVIKMFTDYQYTKLVLTNGSVRTSLDPFEVENLAPKPSPFLPLTVSSSKTTELIHRDHITALLPNERGGAKVLLSDGSHIWTLEDHDAILDMMSQCNDG